MTTARETALAALATLCTNTFEDKFERDPDKAPDASAAGTIVQRDGDAGDPEITLSPVTYIWDHGATLEFAAVGDNRNATVDGLLKQFDTALAANRTLGGVVNDARVMAGADFIETEGDGTETVRSALVTVNLNYQSSSPIG